MTPAKLRRPASCTVSEKPAHHRHYCLVPLHRVPLLGLCLEDGAGRASPVLSAGQRRGRGGAILATQAKGPAGVPAMS